MAILKIKVKVSAQQKARTLDPNEFGVTANVSRTPQRTGPGKMPGDRVSRNQHHRPFSTWQIGIET